MCIRDRYTLGGQQATVKLKWIWLGPEQTVPASLPSLLAGNWRLTSSACWVLAVLVWMNDWHFSGDGRSILT
eukprot:694316-Pyramimonas_sp.AAC.1